MSRKVRTGRIEVFRPTNLSDSPDFEIPGEDVDSVNSTMKLAQQVDEGTIVLHNHDGRYTPEYGDTPLRSGDRLDFYVTLDSYPTRWANTSLWGAGGWGGELLRWSAKITKPKHVRGGDNQSYLKLKCEDFVSGVLNDRIAYDAFEDTKIAGTKDAILNTVLRHECPEIDLSRVEEVNATTDIMADGTEVLDLVTELAKRADAVVYGRRDMLIFKPTNEIGPEWHLDPVEDVGTFSVDVDGESIYNMVRVDGGESHAVDDAQTTVDTTTTVTDSTRAQFQVKTRKSQLERVALYTSPTGSEESITVRVQKDDGGAPVAPNDQDSDVDNKQLSYEFLANDGWTDFLMNDHTLPEPNPWILVETDGPDGQQIGTDANGNEAYEAHYPYPIAMRVQSTQSQKKHGLREKRVQKDNITTSKAARDRAKAHLDHSEWPEKTFEAPAISERAHGIIPGEAFSADLPRERLVGDWIVTKRTDTYDGSDLTTQLQAAEVSSI